MTNDSIGSRKWEFNAEDWKRLCRDFVLQGCVLLAGLLLTFIGPIQELIMSTVGMNFSPESYPYMAVAFFLAQGAGGARRLLTDYTK